jgi:hypothetical protein
MVNRRGKASLLRDQAHELRTELARKIALFTHVGRFAGRRPNWTAILSSRPPWPSMGSASPLRPSKRTWRPRPSFRIPSKTRTFIRAGAVIVDEREIPTAHATDCCRRVSAGSRQRTPLRDRCLPAQVYGQGVLRREAGEPVSGNPTYQRLPFLVNRVPDRQPEEYDAGLGTRIGTVRSACHTELPDGTHFTRRNFVRSLFPKRQAAPSSRAVAAHVADPGFS